MRKLVSVIDKAKSRITQLPVSTIRVIRRKVAPATNTTPVFVVGCQRTGTTMVMDAFNKSTCATVYRGGNRKVFDRNLLLLDTDTVKQAIANSGTTVAVFKPMNELQHTIKWLDSYPDLRVIWMIRNVDDVVNSCVRKFNSMRESLGRIVDDPESSGWWGEGLSEDSLSIVRRFYRTEMSLEDAYAVFWYIRNSFYFDLNLQKQSQVRLFKYEQIVAEPAKEFEQLFAFSGCPFKQQYISDVVASSVRRHPAPMINRELRVLCEAQHKNIESIIATY